jgi:hypothetical protein
MIYQGIDSIGLVGAKPTFCVIYNHIKKIFDEGCLSGAQLLQILQQLRPMERPIKSSNSISMLLPLLANGLNHIVEPSSGFG